MKLHHPFTILISWIAPLVLFSSCDSNQDNRKDNETLSYSIKINQASSNIASIKVEFTPKDNILYMQEGATELPNGWGSFIHNIQVVDEDFKPINVTKLQGAKWKLDTELGRKLTLTYDLHLDHQDYDWSGGIDGVAYSTELGVFYTGKTLFILNGKQRNNITIDFNLPSGWIVTTPWHPRKNGTNSFQANNHEDLLSSMIFAGNHEELSLERNGFELVFALGSPETIADKQLYHNLAQGVLNYYIDLMGGIPNPPSANPFKKAVVVISSNPSITDGEAIGNNISILIKKDGGQLPKTISRLIFAHEFFHLWNGKSFIPANESTEWFNEGFTNYYTLKALRHVGYLNDESFLELLSNFFYERYNNDNAVGEFSMTEGQMRHDHWGLVYVGGMFVGISQDMIIRNSTNNEKSLDDLMRMLFHKYGGSDKKYDIDELENMMSELSGEDQSHFFETYVKGKNKIPIEDYLQMASLNARVDNGKLKLSIIDEPSRKKLQIMEGFFGALNSGNEVLSQVQETTTQIKN